MILRVRMTGKVDEKMFEKPCKEAEAKLAKRVAKDTDKYVPKATGELANVEVRQNIIIYKAPYARAMFYGKKLVDAKSGVVGFPIGNGEYRSRAGEKKVKSDKDWHYQNGGAFWFYRAKTENLGAWAKFAKREVKT